MNSNNEKIEYLLNVFKVLGDKTRLQLFSILLTGDHCNCELGAITGCSNNLISHHMHVLIEAGLINATRKLDDARWIIYSVNRNQLVNLQQILGSLIERINIPEREPCCSTTDNHIKTELTDESF